MLSGGFSQEGKNCATSTIFEGYGAQKTSVFWATYPGPFGEEPPECLELLQPEAQSVRQAAAPGGLPLLFVRVSTMISPKTSIYDMSLRKLSILNDIIR